MKTLYFVTSNDNKFEEAQMALPGINLERIDIDIDEIQSDDIVQIAKAKAQAAYLSCGKPVLVEDSGFYIDALGGFPGPLVKFVEKAMGMDGILRLLGDDKNRAAQARAVVVYYDGEETLIGVGELEGIISHTIKGDSGFFFDYFFIPNGYKKTCAELGLELKTTFSHRTRAFKDLLDKLG